MCKNQTTPATPQVDCPTKENIFHLCGKARIMEIAPVSPKSLYSYKLFGCPEYHSCLANNANVSPVYCQISAQISLRAYILHGARHGARDVDCALPAVRLTGGSCAALGGGSARTPRTASWHRAHLHTRPGQLGIAQDSSGVAPVPGVLTAP